MPKSTLTFLMLPLAALLLLAGCSDNENDGAMCNAPTAGQVRAPAGDSLCAARASCSTSGQPDHQGCPNTCSCLCHEGRCYQQACTAIASCTDDPVYR
jgi:hypothetical protein